MRELSLERRCRDEYRLLGFCLSAHPLLLLRSAPIDVVPACRMAAFRGRTARMLGWAVAAKLVRVRASGAFMKFLSCEDLTGLFEAVLFPDAYRRLAPLALGPGPYLLSGRIEGEQGTLSLAVEELTILEIEFARDAAFAGGDGRGDESDFCPPARSPNRVSR